MSAAAASTPSTSTSAAAAAASASSSKTGGTSPDFLVLILELDPRQLLSDRTSAQLLLDDDEKEEGNALTSHLLPALLIFLNAHIALQNGNGLAIYLACPSSPTRLIYTSAPGRMSSFSAAATEEANLRPDPNTYQHFGVVNRALWKAVRSAVQDSVDRQGEGSDEEDEDSLDEDVSVGAPLRKKRRRMKKTTMTGTGPLVSALSQALAHLNNIPPSTSSSTSASSSQSALPSGHSATVLPRAASTPGSRTQVAAVAGGGLSSWRPRILILSALDGGMGGTGAGSGSAMAYVPLMNCIFAAQKRSILIDVLKLTQGQDVVFLQQAAHLTGGNYLRLDLDEKGDAVPSTRDGSKVAPNHTRPLSLLQVLMTTFLPSRDLRYFPPSLSLSFAASASTDASGGTTGIIRLPTLDSVDFRAACFCHRKVVDVGFVCSVCLSIFCEPRKECLICGSHFPRSTMRRFADEHTVSAAIVEHARLSSSTL
ncbi:hypothetical protein A4X13_0g6134 [Tilletia indica]|uniref:General transcription and DNA repair factor IIH subunit TFB4 n=1 Tax=Tilletia indica TaxID=43049 RepID=A0A177TYX5_9BASI|nr:hypothetical protein A4X13_0g6134 [Tilletia indica]